MSVAGNPNENVLRLGSSTSGTQLRQCVFQNYPKMVMNIPNPSIPRRGCVPGIRFEMLSELCRLLNARTGVTCQLTGYAQKGVGAYVNGSWNSVIGRIVRGKIDASLIDVTDFRKQFLHFSTPVKSIDLYAVHPFPRDENYWMALKIFNTESWMCLVSFCALFTTFLSFATPKSPNGSGHYWSCSSLLSIWGNAFAESCVSLFQNSWFLQSHIQDPSKRVWGRFLLLTWRLGSVFLIATYSSGILTNLVVENQVFPFTDYDTMISCFERKRCIQIATNRRTSVFTAPRNPRQFPRLAPVLAREPFRYGTFEKPESIAAALLYQGGSPTTQQTVVEFKPSDQVASILAQQFKERRQQKSSKSTKVTRTDGRVQNDGLNGDCKLAVLKLPAAFRKSLAFCTNRSHCNGDVGEAERKLRLINTVLTEMHQTGLFIQVANKYLSVQEILSAHRKSCYTPSAKAPVPIPVQRYIGLIVPVSGIMAGAVLAFAWECFSRRCCIKFHRLNEGNQDSAFQNNWLSNTLHQICLAVEPKTQLSRRCIAVVVDDTQKKRQKIADRLAFFSQRLSLTQLQRHLDAMERSHAAAAAAEL